MADYDAQPGRKPPAERERSRAQMEADEVDLHARLWRASDCEFARDTIEIAAAFIDGGTVGLATSPIEKRPPRIGRPRWPLVSRLASSS